jgi:hypothetical protein
MDRRREQEDKKRDAITHGERARTADPQQECVIVPHALFSMFVVLSRCVFNDGSAAGPHASSHFSREESPRLQAITVIFDRERFTAARDAGHDGKRHRHTAAFRV